MDSRPKYKSTLAFTDLLFNILIGFAFMFIIAFLLINPVEKEAQVEAKAEFMIVMEWDDQSAYDVDLWMSDPVGNIVGFPNMHAGLLHLDKDDLGQSNDTVVLADGTTKIIYLNREVMTIRGIVPGEYVVNNHLYSMKGQQKKGPMEVTTRIIKLNPFSEIHTGVVTLLVNGAEETVIRFTVNPEGNVTSKNHRKKRFAGRRHPNGIVSGSSNSSMHPPPTGGGEQILQGDEPADDDEVHGSAGFDDELHEQTGTSFAGGREPVVEGENGERSGTERSRYSYTITGAGQSTTTQSAEDRPHAEEEDPAMGGR